MAKKRFLSLDDLRSFYEAQNKNVTFSSNDNDSSIIVHIDEPCVFEEEDSDDDSDLNAHLWFCHIDENRNGSSISESAMKKAMPSLREKPILAYIYKDDDGNYQFEGHEYYKDDDGEYVYLEHPVGFVPSNAKLELVYEKDMDKTYLEGNGRIWRNYSQAANILEREGSCKVSVEIAINELSYDAKSKILNITDFVFNGVTILGRDSESGKEIGEGMLGSNITIDDFSKKNNSVFSTKLINELKKFNENFEAFKNIQIPKEGGNQQLDKFNELLKKYNVTAEDVKFDYSKMSDDEMEAAFKEAFEKQTDGNGEHDTPSSDGTDNGAEFSDGADDGKAKPSSDSHEIKYTVDNKEFSVSLNDKIYALTALVNDTYGESDNAYYNVIAYDDRVVMVDCWTGTAYRQEYKVRKDVYSLQGDRVSVHSVYLTDDEEKELDNMKANYSSISDELKTYQNKEAEEKKTAILNSEDYSAIHDEKDYKDLVKDHANFSVEDVQSKCDAILLSYVKNNKAVFKQHNEPDKKPVTSTPLPIKNKPSRYGNLFNKN